jgi:hypothetical protein
MDRSKHKVSIPVEDYEELLRDAERGRKYNADAFMVKGHDATVLRIDTTDVQVTLGYTEVQIVDGSSMRRFVPAND